MCGIAGIYNSGGGIQPEWVKRMTDTLRHRGPDDEGYLFAKTQEGDWIACGGEDTVKDLRMPLWKEIKGQSFSVALGHRRLSILDLSPAGHGPMSFLDGQLWITYNGEIYNYLELREELKRKGYVFRTGTDTEVILAAYAEWGIECLSYFNGMWAFALVDFRKGLIFCSRDRAGVKPFYYSYDGRRFCFASEIKALLDVEGFTVEPNEQIIADYLFLAHSDHTNETFFKGIYQLKPGECLLMERDQLRIQPYWDIGVEGGASIPDGNVDEQFFELFQDAIRLRLRSDVHIGTCLSGGLDSSSIVCLANHLMFDGQSIDPALVGQRQKTFSSCFEDPTYDERKFIEMVLQKTGAEKNYIFPQPEALGEELVKLIWHQDEPFSSTSIYAQWNVMKLVRSRGVTVLLDGQGGDELLGGYLPSFSALFLGMLDRRDLLSLLRESFGFCRHHRDRMYDGLQRIFASMVPTRLASSLQSKTAGGTVWADEGFQKKYLREHLGPGKFKEPLNDYLYQIFRSTILPSLLRYEDRNSMAFSLETRLPFLDYRLVEFSFRLPVEKKIRRGVTKVILRKAMEGILPEAIRCRMDKMGFVTPEINWFRNSLRGLIGSILHSKSFSDRGYFNVKKVKEGFEQHCQGKIDIHPIIWRWMNLELWFQIFMDRSLSPGNRMDDGLETQ